MEECSGRRLARFSHIRPNSSIYPQRPLLRIAVAFRPLRPLCGASGTLNGINTVFDNVPSSLRVYLGLGYGVAVKAG